MLKFFFILTCLLLPGLQTDWYTLHGVKERYRVDFPGAPGKDSSHTETSVYYYVPDKQAGDKNFDYTFMYSTKYRMSNYNDMLNTMSLVGNSMIKGADGKELYSQWAKYHIFPGKRVCASYNHGNSALMMRIYATGTDRIYGLFVSCPIADTANANAKRFFDSFYLKD